jgi:hypothetical protein
LSTGKTASKLVSSDESLNHLMHHYASFAGQRAERKPLRPEHRATRFHQARYNRWYGIPSSQLRNYFQPICRRTEPMPTDSSDAICGLQPDIMWLIGVEACELH